MSDVTTADLVTAKHVTGAQLEAAVDAYFAGAPVEDYAIADGYTLNLRAAVEASSRARAVRAEAGASMLQRRNVVREAVLLEKPQRCFLC